MILAALTAYKHDTFLLKRAQKDRNGLTSRKIRDGLQPSYAFPVH